MHQNKKYMHKTAEIAGSKIDFKPSNTIQTQPCIMLHFKNENYAYCLYLYVLGRTLLRSNG